VTLSLDRSDWQKVKFGDVVRQVKASTDPVADGVKRYVAGEHMDSDSLAITRWGMVGDGYLGPAFHRKFKSGHVLYGSRRTYLRKVALADFDGVCANTTFVMESADTSRLLPELLPFVMSTEAFHAHSIAESKGSVNPYVNWPDIAKYEFELPPLDQQQRIADLLWQFESASKASADSADAIDLALSTFCRSSYVRLKDATCQPLAEVARIQMGRQKAPKYMKGEHPTPFLSVANVGTLELKLEALDVMDFDPVDRERYQLNEGDLLLTEGDLVSPMNVGRPAIYSGGPTVCCFQNTLLRLVFPDSVPPLYALAIIEGMRVSGVFAAAASTTTVTHLGLRRISPIPFPLSDQSERERVASGLRCLLSSRDAIRVENRYLQSLKSRVMEGVLGALQ